MNSLLFTDLPVIFKRLSLRLAVMVLAAGTALSAPAQDSPPTTTTSPTTSATKVDWLARGLSPKTVEIPSIGLSLHLPVDSGYTQKPQAERRLEAWANDQSWIAAIDVQLTSNPAVTVATVADETIETNRRQSVYLTIPERASLMINGQPAERLLLKLRPQKGQEEVHAMYTIFRPLPQTFVIHKIWTKVSNAEAVLKIQRAVVESFRFTDPAELVEIRRNEVGRMSAILDALTRADYERMLLPSRWYRIYRYKSLETLENEGAAGGALSTIPPLSKKPSEVAYYRIEERVGMLGEVNKSATTANFSAAERAEGILVTLMSRYLLIPDGSAYVDIESTAWMSFDRERERWSIRSASYIKDPNSGQYLVAERRTMTGDRRGGTMQIVRDFPPAVPETAKLRVPREAYINQAEQHLLYRILQPFTSARYGMYLYEPRLGRIAYRTEAIQPGTPARSASKRQKDADSHHVTLGSDGTIRRLDLVNGDITVPIKPQELLAIWKANNLPTGKGSRESTLPRLSNPVTEREAEKKSEKRRR